MSSETTALADEPGRGQLPVALGGLDRAIQIPVTSGLVRRLGQLAAQCTRG